MGQLFVGQTLRRRAVALLAAYVIALASLLAGFSAPQAVDDTGNSLGVICHGVGGHATPAGGQNDGNAGGDNCCVGCLMLMATLPPPPVKVTGAPQSAGQLLSSPVVAPVAADPFTKTHRSRAPPLMA